VAMMLPYTAAVDVVWTVFLIIWYLMGGPFGVWLLGSEGVPSWFERVMLTGFYAGRKQQLRM
jgi:hypothetical protein